MKLTPVTQLNEQQLAQLHQLYQGEWWSRGRTLPDITRAIAGTDYIFGFAEPDSGRLVIFARVLSDRVYKALLLDVIVHPDYRGQGLGRMLVDAVVSHPDLAGVRQFELYCRPELRDFYRQWGFTDDIGEIIFMRKTLDAQKSG
ncbi:MAG: GNAT family N-acetyltransferase [Methylacidiphilales bacterium]|nr:GNAT family N-acetyltransferase [Candidatus Methylacidiphilales bacterium]